MSAPTLSREQTLRELPTGAGALRYHDVGDGPPLVLLHGSGPGVSGWQNYRGILADLAASYRCLVLEFPGFGISDASGPHPMLSAGPSVTALLDGLGLESVALLGNSMGAIIAANVAAMQPDRVRALVTIGGVGVPLFGPTPSDGLTRLMDFADEPTREHLVAWLHSMVSDPARVTEELIEERWALATTPDALAANRAMYSRAAFTMQQQAMAASPKPPYWAMLHRVQAPTLLTWGRDDRVSPLDSALLPMRLIPNAELHVFPNCGHWAMVEARDAFVSAVLAFLSRTYPRNGS